MPDPTDQSKPLAVVVPELFRRTGGVQVFSRNFVRAMDNLLGYKVPVITMNDRRGDLSKEFAEGRSVTTCGEWSSRIRSLKFAWAMFFSSRNARFLSTHPNASRFLGLLQQVFGTEYLVVAHGVDVWNLTQNSLRNGLRRAERVLPVSRYTCDRIVDQLGERLPEMTIFPNMVDTTRFSPGRPETPWREKLGIPSEARVILTVTRLDQTEERKGYDLVLEVFNELRGEFSNLYWILAGKGEDKERIESKAKTLGVLEYCRFPGFIDDTELVDLYRSVDAFVLPSQKEGFGIVFLEAIACGLPVIGGNLDGSVDALDQGRLGFLVDPNSTDELETALRGIWENSIDIPFRSDPDGAYKAVKDQFGSDKFEFRLGSILDELEWR